MTLFFRDKKNLEEKINFWFWFFVEKKSKFIKKLNDEKIENLIFLNKNQKSKFYFFFEIFFWSRKKSFTKKILSMSIRKFPKNPKIALRKACNEHKYSKNADSESWNKNFPFFNTNWHIRNPSLANPLWSPRLLSGSSPPRQASALTLAW